MRNERWAVFISGRGTNAQAVFDLPELNVALCVSSKKNAAGLARARRQGITSLVLEKQVDWQKLHQELKQRRISKIFLLGFMKLLPADFAEKWQGRIFNVHPSLLPEYPGIHSIERSYHDRAAMGVTVHEVITEMDAGKKILQYKILEKGHQHQLEEAELKISMAEQRLVRQVALRKNVWN